MSLVKLIQVLPEGVSGKPQKREEPIEVAQSILNKSKSWNLDDEKFDFVDGVIFEKGKAPKKVESDSITLVDRNGREKDFDFALAEKVLRKSERKGTWKLSPKEGNFKFDGGLLVRRAAKKPSENKPKAEKPIDK